MLYSDHPAGEVEAAVELALEKNLSASEGVRHLLLIANETTAAAAPLSSWQSLPAPDVSAYGALGGVQ